MISEISPDIGYLDLTTVFKSAAKRNTQVFLSDDTHWSSEGHQVVAEALAGAVDRGNADGSQKGLHRGCKTRRKVEFCLITQS